MTHPICDECETVVHCTEKGCIPLTPMPVRPEPVEEKKEDESAKRLFQVYRTQKHFPGTLKPVDGEFWWRWRLIAPRNGQIVGGSQEAFDSRSNALRAARREASFYQPGMASVELSTPDTEGGKG